MVFERIQPKIMRDRKREREKETDRKRENEREREWGLPFCACLHVPGSLAYHRVHKRGQNKINGTITRILQKLVASPTGQSVTELSF